MEGGWHDSGSSRPDDALNPMINCHSLLASPRGSDLRVKRDEEVKTTKTERLEQIMACLMKIMDENVSCDVEDWVRAQKDDSFCRQIYTTLKEKPVFPADQVDSSR